VIFCVVMCRDVLRYFVLCCVASYCDFLSYDVSCRVVL